jgi:hypothetical protein
MSTPPGGSYKLLIDSWSWTLLEADATTREINVTFIGDDGKVLRTILLKTELADLGNPKLGG